MTTPTYQRPWGWTDEDHEMLAVLFGEGLGVDDIAQAMDRTVASVNGALVRNGYNRGAINCLACGRVLSQPAAGRRKLYCDKACGQLYRSQCHDPKDTTKETRDQPRTCTVCGGTLTPEQISRRLAKKLPLTYCSGVCRQRGGVSS